jgi:hypothetical protein
LTLCIISADAQPESSSFVEEFRIEPLFARTPLIEDPANQHFNTSNLFISIAFVPLITHPFFVHLRHQWWYQWAFIAFILFVVVTQMIVPFQTSFWWMLLYFVPFCCFAVVELTEADKSTYLQARSL